MAKRYARINWQNRPNVATPISATNLNKMDKGIDDIDNAIEEIYNKRVNNVVTTNPDTFLAGPVGKTLQDQITTLNNKLTSLVVKHFNLSLSTPITFEYTNYAFLVGGRQASGKKASYFFDGAGGITAFHENSDFTININNKEVTISSSSSAAIHLILFMA